MAITRVRVNPEVLKWACERATPSVGDVKLLYPKVASWIKGETEPTLRQLETFANAARVAVGFLFLTEPPEEHLPIKDLRTKNSHGIRRASPDLLDTIYACQYRQEWYAEYSRKRRIPKCPLVNIATIATSPEIVAKQMEKIIDFDIGDRRECKDLDEVFRIFIDRSEAAGVLVMVGGTVGPNPYRPLNTDEFRGFALVDDFAPVVFVNGKDSKAAKMFTLAHELAHLCLGESAVSNNSLNGIVSENTEVWCNRVAAEYLVPSDALYQLTQKNGTDIRSLASEFKVSRPVILRRLLDTGVINRERFDAEYGPLMAFYEALPKDPQKKSGGSPYRTLRRRVSSRFANAVIGSAFEGETLLTDAFKLLEVKNSKSLRELGKLVGYHE